uniref:Uncharacterized protein n=1 Tax=Anopheles dirus TaxID=7168 RepID=A0A182NMQ8_9DIPT
MVIHMKPHFYRMCNLGQRLLICAVFFLNLFIDLAAIDGHVLPRPLTSTTTSSILVRNFDTESNRNIATITIAAASISAAATHASHESSAVSTSQAPDTTDNQHTRSDLHRVDGRNITAGKVLVVAPENFSIEQLRRGFDNFARVLQTSRSPTSDDNLTTLPLLDNLVQFRSWRGMVTFERWLEDPAFTSVLYLSDESDSFIGYCDSLSTHLSTVYRKSVLFWPCPRMK